MAFRSGREASSPQHVCIESVIVWLLNRSRTDARPLGDLPLAGEISCMPCSSAFLQYFLSFAPSKERKKEKSPLYEIS
jgi:hypothetical protein